MQIRSLAAAAVFAASFLVVGCDHLRSKDASAQEHSNDKTTASAPQNTMPSSDRYGGGDAGQPQ